MLSLLIGILITLVVGAICFWAIDRFSPDARLGQLLKLLVVLVCLASNRDPTASVDRISLIPLAA
jgi:hypothetical protein